MIKTTTPEFISNADLRSRTQNEQEIKQGVIIPYLEAIGINSDRLEFETEFKMTFGRDNNVTSPKKWFTKRARLDILCSDEENNYFIIEVKSEGVSIDENDVKQGVSYARAVHPIAPYVIITNGKETRIVDSIKMEDVNGQLINDKGKALKLNFQVSVEDSLKAHFQALKNFIGYSSHNIRVFNDIHLANRMSSIRGDSDNLSKKYVPELFLENRYVLEQFDLFMASDSTVFGLIGEGGVGKTNAICDLALRHAEENIVLFSLGSEVFPTILTCFRDEFNWIFSESLEPDQIINRLIGLLGEKSHLLIFIDAIDESSRDTIRDELEDLIRKLKDFKRVKICVSCKTSIWPHFLDNMGNPTALLENLYNDPPFVQEQKIQSSTPGVMLSRLNDTQVAALDRVYQKHFKYKGDMPEALIEMCKLPFWMMIISEVYADSDLPDNASDLILLQAYLEKKYEKMDKEVARNTLVAIAEFMIDVSSSNLNGVPEDQLRSHLNLRHDEKLLPELFDHYILSRYTTNGRLSYINFYFSRIRDYMIAIEACNLLDKSGNDFRQSVMQLLETSLGQSALGWYCPLATPKQSEILLEHYRSRALLFVDEYSKLIDTHFPNLRSLVEPYTDDEIGIIMEEPSEIGLFGYSLRPNDSGERIIVTKAKTREELDADYFRSGGLWWKMDSDNYITLSPAEAAKKYLFRSIDNTIIRGELQDTKSIIIATEIIGAFVRMYKNELGLNEGMHPNDNQGIAHYLPLDYDRIQQGVNYTYARYYARERVSKRKLSEGDVVQTGKDSYHMSFTSSDFQEIDKHALEIHEKNKNLPKPLPTGAVPPFDILITLINELSANNITITEPLLPEPEIPVRDIDWAKIQATGNQNNRNAIIVCQYTSEGLKEFVKKYYLLYLEAYQEIVDHNFPIMKSHLPFYKNLYYHIHIALASDPLSRDHYWTLRGASYSNREKNIVDVCIDDSPDFINKHLDTGADNSIGSGIEFIFAPSSRFEIQGDSSISALADLCIIRSRVYDQIKQEIGYIYGAI